LARAVPSPRERRRSRPPERATKSHHARLGFAGVKACPKEVDIGEIAKMSTRPATNENGSSFRGFILPPAFAIRRGVKDSRNASAGQGSTCLSLNSWAYSIRTTLQLRQRNECLGPFTLQADSGKSVSVGTFGPGGRADHFSWAKATPGPRLAIAQPSSIVFPHLGH